MTAVAERAEVRERGSALLLFPAGVLILIVFAALAFDVALAHQRKRQLLDVAASAANDAVTYGLDEAELRATGTYCLDPERVRRAVGLAIAASTVDVDDVAISVGGRCDGSVTVRLRATSPAPFSAAIPGMDASTRMAAERTATVRER